VLVAVSANGLLEVIFGGFGQKYRNWLDGEVNSHDVVVFLNLHIASVFFEEFVQIFELFSCRSYLLSKFDFFTDFWE
jgi:hypothetical protein